MAFDAFASHRPAAPPIPEAEEGYPVVAGGDISVIDRVALIIGYTAFGLAVGATAALMLGGLSLTVLTVMATAPVLAALALASVSIRQVNLWAAPVLIVAVAAALAAPARVFLFGDARPIFELATLSAGLLLIVSLFFCRTFAAAISVALLGLVLAAPVGAAAMISMFG